MAEKKNNQVDAKNFYFVPTAYTKKLKKCRNGKYICGIHAKISKSEDKDVKKGDELWIDIFGDGDKLKDLRNKLSDDIDNKKVLHAFGVNNKKYHSITAFVINSDKPRTKKDSKDSKKSDKKSDSDNK